jgi:hypothetical protein
MTNPAWAQQAPPQYTTTNADNVRNYYRNQGILAERQRIIQLLEEAGMKELASLISDRN